MLQGEDKYLKDSYQISLKLLHWLYEAATQRVCEENGWLGVCLSVCWLVNELTFIIALSSQLITETGKGGSLWQQGRRLLTDLRRIDQCFPILSFSSSFMWSAANILYLLLIHIDLEVKNAI